MRLLLGQLIKEKLIGKIQEAKYYSILVNEVTDSAVMEQLLIYVGYADAHGESHFDFLEVKDILKPNDSANVKTITTVILEVLHVCGLTLENLCGFGSDGVSEVTGSKGGVGASYDKKSLY